MEGEAEARGMAPHGECHGLPACYEPYLHSAREKIREVGKGGQIAHCRFWACGEEWGRVFSSPASASTSELLVMPFGRLVWMSNEKMFREFQPTRLTVSSPLPTHPPSIPPPADGREREGLQGKWEGRRYPLSGVDSITHTPLELVSTTASQPEVVPLQKPCAKGAAEGHHQ